MFSLKVFGGENKESLYYVNIDFTIKFYINCMIY